MAKVKTLKVGLYLRYRTPEGKQSPNRPVLYDAKKRIRPGWCTVAGVAEHHPDCTYHLRYKKDGKDTWEAVGSDPNTASALRAARSCIVGTVDVPTLQPTPPVASEPTDPTPASQNSFGSMRK
jgi:hypothetical protein